MKKLSFIKKSNGSHWVGDGFPVRNIFSYEDIAEKMSPFILLDYAGPKDFPITEKKLGVGEHPHRGFETVTIVYDGEVSHRDSSGGGGTIGTGEVQWMTAASGVVHEEFHSRAYAQRGGIFEVVQLWVNLPKKDKMSAPKYQGITRDQIPSTALPHNAGEIRVIAGNYNGIKGPASTYSPIDVWDLRIKKGSSVEFKIPEGHTTSIFVLKGNLKFDGGVATEAELAVFETSGSELKIAAETDTTALLLSGQPLNEPIVGYGPFVMNTEEEIRQAYSDYKSGKMGRLPNP